MTKDAEQVKSVHVKRKAPLRAGGTRSVYGFILAGRALAEAAVRLGDRPASLRVLVVLSSYMSGTSEKDPSCRVSRATIGDVLGIRREAVIQHLAVLKDKGILAFESVPGETTRFTFAPELLEELRTKKPRANAIEAGRAERRAKRAAERKGRPPAAVKPSPRPATASAANARQRPTASCLAPSGEASAPSFADLKATLAKTYGREAAGEIMDAIEYYAEDAGVSVPFLLDRFGIAARLAEKRRWRTADLIATAEAIKREAAAGKFQVASAEVGLQPNGLYDFS